MYHGNSFDITDRGDVFRDYDHDDRVFRNSWLNKYGSYIVSC